MPLDLNSNTSPSPSVSLAAPELFSVKGKTVLVTGGGRGIGLMITEGFITNGAKVFIVSRDQKALEEQAKRLNALGKGECVPVQGDLSTLKGLQEIVRVLTQEKGLQKLDVLVNNSGVAWGEPIEKFQERGWDRVMDLNVKSLFFLTRELLPLLKKKPSEGTSAIINIGSTAGLRHQLQPTYSYDVSKAAVHHLTKKFAFDFAKYNITVNAIAPGFVPSKMSKTLKLTPEQLEAIIPLRRVGEPQDMAGLAIFLASPAATWISGAIIPVDGAQTVTTVISKL